jgi:hypothetical protein
VDARDAEPRDAAWNRVSENFATLGDSLRRRYEQDADDAVEGSRDTVQDALRTLGDAVERLASTVSTAIRDPQVQADARQAASSLVDALGMTFSRMTGEVRERMDRSRGADEDVWEAPERVEIEQPRERRDEPGPPTE